MLPSDLYKYAKLYIHAFRETPMSQTHAAPGLREMLTGLIQARPVSSVSPQFDMSNRPAAERIAGWLERLGFRCSCRTSRATRASST